MVTVFTEMGPCEDQEILTKLLERKKNEPAHISYGFTMNQMATSFATMVWPRQWITPLR